MTLELFVMVLVASFLGMVAAAYVFGRKRPK